MTSQARLPELTGLRGLAALYVLLFHIPIVYWGHYPGQTPFPNDRAPWGFNFGWIGVDLFFVLSGFLLSMPMLKPGPPLRSASFWKTYLAKRWLRIAPPYYAAMVPALAIGVGFGFILEHPWHVVAHLAYVHTWWIETFGTINPAFWSLGVEFQFYLLLPFLAFLMTRRLWPLYLGLLLAAGLVVRALPFYVEGTWLFSFNVPGYIIHFCLGIAAAKAFVAGMRLPFPALATVPAVLLVFVSLPLWWFLSAYTVDQATESLWANVVVRPSIAAGFSFAVFLVVSQDSLWAKLVRTPPVQVLGEVSYSLYLIHLPTLLVVRDYAGPIGRHPWIFMIVGVLASLLAAMLFYALVEGPSLRFRGRMVRRPVKAGVPVPSPSAWG